MASQFFTLLIKKLYSVDPTQPVELYALILNSLRNLFLWHFNNGLQLNFSKCVIFNFSLIILILFSL